MDVPLVLPWQHQRHIHPMSAADGTRRRPGGVLDVAGKAALFVVAGRREGILLAWLPELAVLDLAAELGALLLVHLGLADVLGDRRRVGSGRYFVRGVVVKAGRDAFFFGKLRELVVIEALRRPTVLTPVPVKLRGELVWV